MKKHLCPLLRFRILFSFLAFFFSFLATSQQSYYWVGDGGNWSDFANHWSTTSGGAPDHTQAPSALDSVFFDANSFTTDFVTVIMDGDSAAYFDWTGMTEQTTLRLDNSLIVSGDIILTPSLTLDSFGGQLVLNSVSVSSFTSNGAFINTGVVVEGIGTWEFQDVSNFTLLNINGGVVNINAPIAASQIFLASLGTLNTNGQSVVVDGQFLIDGNVDISNSVITAFAWQFFGSSITASNSTININDTQGGNGFFNSTNQSYNDLNIINGGNIPPSTFNNITISPGNQISFEAFDTVFVNQLNVFGTPGQLISLVSNSPGNLATISQITGTVDANWVGLRDIRATGGAVFNATDAIDLSGNVGWNFISTVPPASFYWVGDSGSWSDFGNHWSTTPGGAPDHIRAPFIIDSVFFDSNSFSSDFQSVAVDGIYGAAFMDWTGVSFNSTLQLDNNFSLSGDVILSPALTVQDNGGIVVLNSSFNSSVFSNGATFQTVVSVDAAGIVTFQDATDLGVFQLSINQGTVNLNGSFSAGAIYAGGLLNTNGQTVDVSGQFIVVDSVDISNSNITAGNWEFYGTGLTTTNSTIRINDSGGFGSFVSSFETYNDLVILNGNSIQASAFNLLELAPGVQMSLPAFDTIFVNQLIVEGTPGQFVDLSSNSPGSPATISQPGGANQLYFSNIQDINATGGANFIAINSIDLGNNTGIVFNPLPNAISFEPANATSTLDLTQNLSVAFDEIVIQGTGFINIFTADDILFESIDVASGRVTGFGTDTISIDPIQDLFENTGYYVLIDAGAVDGSDPYVGISNKNVWSFDTFIPFGGLLENGNFEAGEAPWFGNALNIQTDGDNSYNFVDVTVAGNPFDVNLSQQVEITQGLNYNLTFDASSDVLRSMVVGIGQNESPFLTTLETVNITTDTTLFSIPLNATDFGGANSRVLFDMGAEVGVVYLDNVSLTLEPTPPVDFGDSTALVALYNSTNGAGWFNQSNWLSGPAASWFGVQAEDGRIVSIDLGNNNLDGTLPPELNNLDSLRILGLQQNNLSGNLPADLSALTRLQEFRIGQNNLSGPLPDYIGNFLELTRFGMSQNDFSGDVPVNYNQLVSLDRWNISSNSIDSLPDLTNLTQMTLFNVSYNLIDAADLLLNAPVITENQGQLETLLESDSLALVDFYNLTDGPNWFNQDNWLQPGTFAVEWNGVFVENGRVARIELQSNNLSGNLPAVLNNLTELRVLGVARNNLSGDLPDLSALINLEELKIGRNNFTGVLPEYISTFSQMYRFGMSNNLFTGSVPASYSNLSSLNNWNISANNLTGLPDLTNMTQLGQFIVSFNSIPKADISLNANVITQNEGQTSDLISFLSQPGGRAWRMAPIEGSFKVGPEPDDGSFFSSTAADLTIRDCFFDDTYSFSDDGTFVVDIQGQTFVETWQGPEFASEGCDDPSLSTLNDYNLLGGGTFSYDWILDGQPKLRVNGKGAYVGLPKAFNGGEYSNTFDFLKDSVVYDVLSYGENDLKLAIEIQSSIWWTLTLSADPIPVSAADSLALVALYNATNGPSWFNKTGWEFIDGIGSPLPVSDWFGVTVSAGEIIEINLNGNNLGGTLPAEVGSLDSLTVLSFQSNAIGSTLPIELFSLPVLQRLYLSNNNFVGDLSQFSNLGTLTQLYVDGNQLTGVIPADLANLASLQQLGLSNNQLEGTLPVELSTLPFLRNLFVDGNFGLTGEVSLDYTTTPIREFLVNQTNICEPGLATYVSWTSTLDLYQGSNVACPQNVTVSDSLALVAIYETNGGMNWPVSNWLQPGITVSEWEGIDVLDGRVVGIDLNGFGVTGNLNASIGDLDALEILGAASNQITGLPDEISQLSSLRSIYLDNNEIQGPIPLAIGNLTLLEEIYVQGNGFSGIIPDTLFNLTNLRALWIAENRLSGDVPAGIVSLSSATSINLSNNKLTGLPADLSGLSSIGDFNISFNDLDTLSASLVLPESIFTFDVRGNALREAPDLTGLNLSNYNVEFNRIPFSNLLTLSNTSGLGGQNFRYQLTADNALPTLGSSVTLSVSSDHIDNTFQWYKDGLPLAGQTSDTLSLSNLTESDIGTYYAEVGNLSLQGVFIFSQQFELEFGVTVKEYAISATASSNFKVNSQTEGEALGIPDSYGLDDTRAWKPTEEDPAPSITLEVENATSFNTLWMSVNATGRWTSTTSYSTDGVAFTEFPIGFSNPGGPGDNLLRWDFETITEPAKFIRVEFDSAQVSSFNVSVDALAIGLNEFSVNRPQDLVLSQRVSENIINIAWGGSGFGEGVIIERAINSEAFLPIDTALVSMGNILREPFTYSDRNAPTADSIYYRVRAFDGSSFSAYSNTLELIICPTPTVLNTDNYWFGDADPNSFTGSTSPQPEITIRDNGDNTYRISDISGGYMDLTGLGFEYYPIEADFSFDCTGQISLVDILNAPGVGCGDPNVEYLSSTYFPGNDSLVFNLRWIGCDAPFSSYFKLTNVPAPEVVPGVQAPAIARSISQPTLDRISITWQDVNEDEEFYLIERSVDTNNNFILIDSVSQLNKSFDDPSGGENVFGEYLDIDISVGSTFYYRLITRNTSGDSDYSDTLSITKQPSLAFERLLNDPSVTDQPNASYAGYWGDYDSDGDPDLYVQNWQKASDPFYVAPNNYFYENNGDGSFTKVSNDLTVPATESRAGSWGDLDNDGDLDYVLQVVRSEVNQLGSPLLLYENNNGNFTERVLGEPTTGGFDHVVLGDLDNDGLLDIISKTFVYFNEGELIFTETSYATLFPEKTEISEPNVHVVDVDMDLDLDIYFGGDAASYLYINNGNRTFTRSNQLGSDDIGHRGGAWGDFDNDGDFDLFITLERKPNSNSFRYYQNDGTGTFQLLDPAALGLGALNLQRGATTIDYNNDGRLDLLTYETNEGLLVVLENLGATQFERVVDPSFTPTNSFVSALSVADFDLDGYQDFFVASGFNSNQSNYIYRNAGSANNHLRINLEGTTANALGLGAIIKVFAQGVPPQTHQVVSLNGTWAGNEITAHFGLASASQADSVIVSWPSGNTSFLENIVANQTITISELSVPTIAFDSISLRTEEYQPELFGFVDDTSATVEVLIQGVTYPAINNQDSTWTLPAATIDSVFNGSYEVIARATNSVGTGTDTATLVVDQRVPIVTIDAQISTIRSPQLTGTISDTTATITVFVEENDYIAAINVSDSTWQIAEGQIQPPLEDGTYDIMVFAENRFGISSDTTTNELRLDATAPDIFVDNIGTSIVSPELTGFVSDTSASLTINVAGRGDFIPEINAADSTWFIPAGTISPDFTEGESPYLITATAVDSVGNSSVGTGELVIANSIQALDASRITSTSFRANWSAVIDAVSYTVEVSRTENFSSLILDSTTTQTNLKVANLDFETTYYYRATFDNGVDQPTTSNVVTVNTTIKQATLDDFNSLALIESATGGSEWTVPSNWNPGTRKQEWDYIIIENERIVELNIPANNLTGRFPFTPLMTALRRIDISDNQLTEIDDLTRMRAVEDLNVSNNLYDFGDLLKLRELTDFTYAPQKTRIAFNETAGADSLLIRVYSDTLLSISANGDYLNYQWFLRDQEIGTGEDFVDNGESLEILSIDYGNMGRFSAEVSNDSLPELSIPVNSMFVFAIADFSVDVNNNSGELIPDNVDGYLLLTTQVDQGFDTLSVARNQPSSFTFRDVILGNYLISIDADREKYVPTYYSDAFEWVEADTVLFRKDTAFQVRMTIIPVELGPGDGEGTLSVVVEEDFGDEAARIEARRRAKGRKCGLKRRVRGGRPGQTDEFVLIAYGETDDNGEFQFGFLPSGTYRFFVEYPGIPLDESSFVEFEVGEQGISDTDFKLEAFATEDGVQVSIERILGVIFEYFKGLKVYPNPTSEVLKLSYRHLADKDVAAQLVDLQGNILWSRDIRSGYDGFEEIDVSSFEEGIYILRLYDKVRSKSNVMSYRIMIR